MLFAVDLFGKTKLVTTKKKWMRLLELTENIMRNLILVAHASANLTLHKHFSRLRLLSEGSVYIR